MTAGTARRLLSGPDLNAALLVAEQVPEHHVRTVLDILGLPREGHQPEHLTDLTDMADAFGTDLHPGRPMTVEAAEAVHEHSDSCAAWPPHGGIWPIPEQRTESSRSEPTIVVPPDLELDAGEDPDDVDRHLASLLPDLADDADDLTASDPVEEPDTAPAAVPDQALALSREARDHAADQALDDVERLVQRVQQYRPTDDPPRAPRGPLTVRCAACHRPIPHDPGKAAAALSEHYTTEHPGGRR